MINISYDGIQFQLLTVNQWTNEVTYSDDGVQPLNRHHDISFTTVLNQATAPWAGQGNIPPAIAKILLEQRLQVPKKKLLIWAYDNNGQVVKLLESPLPIPGTVPVKYYESDAIDGPKLKVTYTKDEASEGALIVGLEIVTDVPLCEAGDEALLSNRFTITYQPDADYHLTRVTDGEAVFRADAMEHAKKDPWLLRSSFMPLVIPPGFHREAALVFDSTGTVCRYRLTDTELPAATPGIVNAGATRVEIIQSRELTSPGPPI